MLKADNRMPGLLANISENFMLNKPPSMLKTVTVVSTGSNYIRNLKKKDRALPNGKKWDLSLKHASWGLSFNVWFWPDDLLFISLLCYKRNVLGQVLLKSLLMLNFFVSNFLLQSLTHLCLEPLHIEIVRLPMLPLSCWGMYPQEWRCLQNLV